MARFTNHAKERLLERYGYADQYSIKTIGALVGTPRDYLLLKKDKLGELREITYKGDKITAVVRDNRIVTFLDPYMHEVVPPSVSKEMRNRYNSLLEKLTGKSFFRSFWYFLILRNTPEYYGLEADK